MAKIIEGILGGFSGRVGTVVGYHRRGQWFVRAYQPNVKDRKSEAQLQQRSRFKAMIQFAAPATPVLRVGFFNAARAACLTEGNVFLRENHRCFSSSTGSAGFSGIDFAGLKFSRGSLPGLRLTEAVVDEGGVLKVRWESLGGVRNDKIHIYIYDAVSACGFSALGTRGEGRVEVLLPEEVREGELHVWAFAASQPWKVSPTAYAAATCQEPADGEEKNFQPSCNISEPRALLKLNYNKTHEPDCCTHPAAPDGLQRCGPD